MGKIKSQFRYLYSILTFGFSEKPVLWISVLLAFLGSILDIVSTTLLYPLSLVAQGIPIGRSGFLSNHFNPEFLTAKWLLLAFLFFLGLRLLVGLVNQGIILRAGKSLYAIISSKIFGIVVRDLPISKLNASGIGHYSSLAGDESFRASNTIINLTQFFNLFCVTTTYFVAIAVFSMKAFLFIAFFLLICFLAMITVFKKLHRLSVRQAELSRIEHSLFIDALNNVKSIRCYNSEALIQDTFSRNIFKYVFVIFQADFYQVFLRAVPLILLVALTGAFLQYSMGSQDALNLTFIIALFAYLSRFFPSLGLCLNIGLRLISDSKSGKDVIEFLHTKPAVEAEARIATPDRIREISFETVSFKYHVKPILEGFTYKFEAGKSYVIIGPSGSGKSTLLDILLKFYPPLDGHVLINDVPLKDISSVGIRSKVALMEQRVTVFNESVLTNVTLGAEVGLDEVRRACKLAKIDAFIEKLPQQYDTVIQYMGANLSGGQRQRIALARAILRNPDVLVLDESLSALDVETKEAIFLDLKELFASKILISVSHDPWIIENSSVVLDFGSLN